MKILLVHPKANVKVVLKDKFSMHEPLALEYVAAGVMDRHDVKILDERIEDCFQNTLMEYQPDVVATTGYTIHVGNCKKILRAAKQFNSRILTVIGGHHATIKAKDFNESYIDVIVIGEGVLTFQEILECWENGKPLDDVKGIAFSKEGLLVRTKYRKYTPLDDLPFPARSLTRKYRNRYFISSMGTLASIRTSLGCFYRCNYCALWQITQGKYLERDPDKVVEELKGIEEGNIFFADDESMLKPERMKVLAEKIKASGVRKRYRLFARSDTIVSHPDLFKEWREIGLQSVIVGLEAFTDEDLEKLNKATTREVNEKAIGILRQNDIEVCADFIVTQDYDREKFRQLSNYVKKLRLKTVIFPILTPLPGTKLSMERNKDIITSDYDLYDFKHTVLPTKMPLKTFYREFKNLHYLAFPLHRRLIYRYLMPVAKYLPTFRTGYEILESLENLYEDHDEKTRMAANLGE